jgi:hypothetical protein
MEFSSTHTISIGTVHYDSLWLLKIRMQFINYAYLSYQFIKHNIDGKICMVVCKSCCLSILQLHFTVYVLYHNHTFDASHLFTWAAGLTLYPFQMWIESSTPSVVLHK